jgi:hypothetical protein
MALDFPNTPTVGQAYQGYVWDGQVWQVQGAAAQGAVRYDIAQGLTSTQQAQGRSNIYAAPFDAMAYSGMQVNGNCDVRQSQATDSSISIPNGYTPAYGLDSWRAQHNSTSGVAYLIAWSNAPVGLGGGVAYQATTAFGATAAGDLAIITTYIEGSRFRRCMFGTANAVPVTIGFWVYSGAGIAGTATFSLINSVGTRSYTSNFTINTPGVWEYKAITVPACTDGVWDVTNGAGAAISFCFCAGTLYGSGANNAWNTTSCYGTPQTTRFFQANNSLMAIAGLIVLPGIEAPSAARLPSIMRPYDQELVACQRYLWRWNGAQYQRLSIGYNDQATTCQAIIAVPLPMRAPPTVTSSNLSVNGTTVTSAGLIGGSSNQMSLQFGVPSGLTVGGLGQIYSANAGGGYLQLDARL